MLFTLGLIWNPLGRQDLWIITIEMNDYGIFCMECSMMVLADDPPALPPSPLPLQFLCFLFVLLTPFGVVWIRRKLNLSKLSAAECLTVTTVCMLALLHRQGSFFSCHCACQQTVLITHLPIYSTFHLSVFVPNSSFASSFSSSHLSRPTREKKKNYTKLLR